MFEFDLPRTFLITSTTVSIVLVWHCWRWIRWQERRAAAIAQEKKPSLPLE